MKRFTTILLLLVTHGPLLQGTFAESWDPNDPSIAMLPVKKYPRPQEKRAFYACPMHHEIREHAPGHCPFCGMGLVKEAASSENSARSALKTPSRFTLGLFLTQNLGLYSMNPQQPMSAPPTQPTPTGTTPGTGNGGGQMPGMPGMSGMNMSAARSIVSGTPSSAMSSMNMNQMGLTPMMSTMMSTALTANAKGAYALSSWANLTVNVLADTDNVLGDPTAGIGFHFPLTDFSSGMASVEFAAPASTSSQNLSRITTIIVSAGPMYMNSGYSFGLMGHGAYTFYSNSSNANQMGMGGMGQNMGGSMSTMGMPQMAMTNSRPLMEHGGMLYLGYPIWGDNLRGFTSAGLNAVYSEDRSIAWMSDATVLRITYNFGDLGLGTSFSLLSDMNNQFFLPNRPFLGLRLDYVFGDRSHLSGADSCTTAR